MMPGAWGDAQRWRRDLKEALRHLTDYMRPIHATNIVSPQYEQRGYIIGGNRHKLKCPCHACRVVRVRAREKLVVKTLFQCG